MLNTRTMLQIGFVVFFIFSTFLTRHFIRLGIVGIIASTYGFLEARYGITKKIPPFWKKLRYWQKGAIVFVIIHIVLFIATLNTFKGEGGIVVGLIEFPLFIIQNLIWYLAHILIPLPFGLFNPKIDYYLLIIWGTVAYAFFGALFGLAIDSIIFIFKVLKKEGENV